MPAIIVPFIPFGIWELRLPVAWSINYLVERFNGIDEGSLTPGRGYGSKGYISQGKKLFVHEIFKITKKRIVNFPEFLNQLKMA